MTEGICKKIPYPGLRNIKTALAVVICVAGYEFIGRDGATMAAIAALICMQDSIEKTIQLGLNRILGTALGGLFGIVFVHVDFFQTNQAVWLISFCIVIVLFIYVCNLIKKNESIVIGCVVFIVIALDTELNAPFLYSINRMLDTMIGIVVSVLVNRFFFKPDVGE